MEAAGLIHAESGDIADVVTKMALADGKNVIFDITMTTSGSVTGRIKRQKHTAMTSSLAYTSTSH